MNVGFNMSKITNCDLPKDSFLSPEMEMYDYVDAYRAVVNGQEHSMEDLAEAFMKSPPDWSEKLFVIRNRLAGMVGLKTAGPKQVDRDEILKSSNFEVGERFGLFQIYQKGENEVILGEDDSHLDFRVSVHKKDLRKTDQIELTVSTTVVFNNWMGRAYFLPVGFFHRSIVKSMVGRMVDILENGS